MSMFVDASALTAILSEEHDADALLVRLMQAADPITSPLAVWETMAALSRILKISPSEAASSIRRFMTITTIQEVPITAEDTIVAISAFENYGKGRHPAGLNFGDCFAYAMAKRRGLPLLFKGNDFSCTDIQPA